MGRKTIIKRTVDLTKLQEHIDTILSNQKSSAEFLVKAGINTKTGNLKRGYK